MNSSFGFFIKNFRIKKGLFSFRNFYKILVSNGLKMDITEYSKIERGIQNPRNKQEFEIIIQSLGITDQKIIAELEEKAISKTMVSKDKIIYPSVVSNKIKNDQELDKMIDFLNKNELPDW